MTLEIIPSILTNDVKVAQDMISFCLGVTKRAQIDIVDGIFANNLTITPTDLGLVDKSLALDFHLMVKEPVTWVEKCVNVGADRIIGQIEMMKSQFEFVEKVQLEGLRVGLAVDLATPVSKIDPLLFSKVDVILLMSVKAGFGGQEFDKSVLAKIKELTAIRLSLQTPFKICVDGGETEDVIDDTFLEGADEVVIGNRLFQGDLAANIKKMQEAVFK